MLTESLQQFNDAPAREAHDVLLQCCGSQAWVTRMRASRPFANIDALLAAADRAWSGLSRADRLEAFRAHPRIGERETTRSDTAARWSAEEQSAVARAADDVRQTLASANAEYERKFGHIFIVFATGKSAEEMLDLLRARLPNDPETELEIASEEQRKIMRLRLRKLIDAGN